QRHHPDGLLLPDDRQMVHLVAQHECHGLEDPPVVFDHHHGLGRHLGGGGVQRQGLREQAGTEIPVCEDAGQPRMVVFVAVDQQQRRHAGLRHAAGGFQCGG
ncbi:hypothetical protein RZS08_57940, partial [Arthrospira platensis SPKY1]|nr:hypothetical protein [Arthrospira platensis SPKY1]